MSIGCISSPFLYYALLQWWLHPLFHVNDGKAWVPQPGEEWMLLGRKIYRCPPQNLCQHQTGLIALPIDTFFITTKAIMFRSLQFFSKNVLAIHLYLLLKNLYTSNLFPSTTIRLPVPPKHHKFSCLQSMLHLHPSPKIFSSFSLSTHKFIYLKYINLPSSMISFPVIASGSVISVPLCTSRAYIAFLKMVQICLSQQDCQLLQEETLVS